MIFLILLFCTSTCFASSSASVHREPKSFQALLGWLHRQNKSGCQLRSMTRQDIISERIDGYDVSRVVLSENKSDGRKHTVSYYKKLPNVQTSNSTNQVLENNTNQVSQAAQSTLKRTGSVQSLVVQAASSSLPEAQTMSKKARPAFIVIQRVTIEDSDSDSSSDSDSDEDNEC